MKAHTLAAGTLLSLGTAVLAAVSCQSAAPSPHPERETVKADMGGGDAGVPAKGTLRHHHVFPADHLPVISGLAVSPTGDVWIAGLFTGSLRLGETTLAGAGGTDVFVARLDPTDSPRSSARIPSPACDGCLGLALDPTGDVILARGNSPTTLVKLDPTGNVLWQKNIFERPGRDDLTERVEAVAGDGAGGILLVNGSDGDLRIGTTVEHGLKHLLVKVDAAGDVVWIASAGGGGIWAGDRARLIAVDGMGHTVVASSPEDKDPTHIRLNAYGDAGNAMGYQFVRDHGFLLGASSLAVLAEREILLTGKESPNPVAGPGARAPTLPRTWLMKLDLSGNRLWVVPADAGKVVADRAGDAYVATGSAVTKFDPHGAVIWRWEAAAGTATLGGVAVDPEGRLVVAGAFRGTYDFGDGPVDGGPGALFVMGFAE